MKKFNVLFTVLLSSTLLLGFSSCDSDDDDDNISYSMNNQDFVTQASSSNMFEIAAGSLAVSQGVNADVKHYGEHMVTDHRKAGLEMEALAKDKGWSVPSTVLAQHQRMLDTLKDMSGALFDKKFAAMMVMSHKQTVALFEQAADDRGVPDGQLRSFAQQKLPVLKEHLEEANDLQADVNNQ